MNWTCFKASKIDLPIDYEHQTANPDVSQNKSGPVPVAGWIKDLAIRKDGIWGQVSWTDKAANLIKSRRYRFLSPVFMSRKTDGAVMILKSAGLVHTPNLYSSVLHKTWSIQLWARSRQC